MTATSKEEKDRQEKSERQFQRIRSELLTEKRQNAEQFDRSVLTLSSAFLAISMGFITDRVKVGEAHHYWMLLTSWVLFALTIITTLFGLLYAQGVFEKLIQSAHKYYIKNDNEALEVSKKLIPRIIKLNWAVGLLFSAAVSFTVAFVILNSERTEMVNPSNSSIPDKVEEAIPPTIFPPKDPEPQSTPVNTNPQQSEQGQDSQESSSSESKD